MLQTRWTESVFRMKDACNFAGTKERRPNKALPVELQVFIRSMNIREIKFFIASHKQLNIRYLLNSYFYIQELMISQRTFMKREFLKRIKLNDLTA